MLRLIPVFFLSFILLSCKKSESDFIWEKSYGKGEALFVQASADSGFIAGGELEGSPYLIRLSKSRSLVSDFKADKPGLFSAAIADTSGCLTAGSSGGKMLLMRFGPQGNLLWEKLLDAGFKTDITHLLYTGNDNYLAIGTAGTDSSSTAATGLFFVRFDKTGKIISQNKTTETSFVSAGKAVADNEGNVFIAITRKTLTANPKASVAKYNNALQRIWETELYNNPEFGAATLGIKTDDLGNIYVGGRTEVSSKDGKLNNSFIASLTANGVLRWKKYTEISNACASLCFDYSGNLTMMNKNCFIINIVNPTDGNDIVRQKILSICVSENTDALGSDLAINFEKNFLIAGSLGGSFYLALKSYQ